MWNVPRVTDTVQGYAREWYTRRTQRDRKPEQYPFHPDSLEDQVSFWCAGCIAAEPQFDYAYERFVQHELRLAALRWIAESPDQWARSVSSTWPQELEERTDAFGDLVSVQCVAVPFEQASWVWAGTREVTGFPSDLVPHRSAHAWSTDPTQQVVLRRGTVLVPLGLLLYVLLEQGYTRIKRNRPAFERLRSQWADSAFPWIKDIQVPLSALEQAYQLKARQGKGRPGGCVKALAPASVRRPPCMISMDTKLDRGEHLEFKERESYVAYFASLCHPSQALEHVARRWRHAFQTGYGAAWETEWKHQEADMKNLIAKVQRGERKYGCKAMQATGHCLWTLPPAQIRSRITEVLEVPRYKLTTLDAALTNPKRPPSCRCGTFLRVYDMEDTSLIPAPFLFSLRE